MQQILCGDKGVSIIEILVVVSIITIGLASLLTLATFSLTASISVKETIRANSLAQETMEAARSFRDNVVWNNNDPANQYDGLGIAMTGVSYHLQKSSGDPADWQLLHGEESVDGYSRKIVFNKVSRNPATDDIETAYDPANDDTDTRKATVSVFWKGKKVEIITYFTNWRQ